MRFITKGAPDRRLEQRNRNPPETSAEATAAWENYRKSQTRNNCIKEQYGLCGYSEVDLFNNTLIIDFITNNVLSRALGYHLEHIEPKSQNPIRTFDHNNLIACAIDDVKARALVKEDVFGGHAKLSWYSPTALIHPLLNNCLDYFHYEITGLIVPKEDLPRRERAKARLTIYKLNLNASILVVWRRNWLSELDLQINELLDNSEALTKFAELELLPDGQYLRPFHSAQRQLFGVIGEHVITDSGLSL